MINHKLIKERRLELKLSQEEVTARVAKLAGGFSQSGYLKIEKGRVEKSKYLPYICHVLGLQIHDADSAISKNIDSYGSTLLEQVLKLPKDERIRIGQAVFDSLDD